MPGRSNADRALDDLFAEVARRTGCDFSQYKASTLGRRTQQRIRHLKFVGVEDYFDYLRQTPEEAMLLQRHLLVGVTSFHRNPLVFDRLLFEWDQAGPRPGPARVWVPACSSGEEVWSLALRLRESSGKPGLQLFATDVDARAVDRARRGWYPESATSALRPGDRDRWFEPEGRGYRVRKELREGLTFGVHNLLADPPFGNLDLVSCRNLLIYLDPEAQSRVLGSFAFALKPGALLVLGTSESAEAAARWFEPLDKKSKIYRRRRDAPARAPVPSPRRAGSERKLAVPIPVPPSPDLSIKELVLDLLARDYVLPSALVDREGCLQFVWGDTSSVFRRSAGRPSDLLLDNLVDGLQVAVANALEEAATGQTTVTVEALRVGEAPGRPLRVIVRPVEAPVLADTHFLVVFQALPELSSAPLPTPDRRVEALERELKDTRAYLRSLVLKLERANEELAAGNEEAQSMNEELQSANEELESSREELQATNEELEMANGHLAKRVEELGRLHNDLANLMASARIAMVFLDRQFRLQRFSPEAGSLLGLRDPDQGRPFRLTSVGLSDADEGAVFERVLRDLQPEEREVPLFGRPYQVRVLPYRTTEDRIEGLVVTLHDLHELRLVEEARRRTDRQFEAMFYNHPSAILLGEAIHDPTGEVVDFWVERVNPTFATWRGIQAEEFVGRRGSEVSRSEHAPRLRLVQQVLASGKPGHYRFQSPATANHLETTAIPLGGDRFALVMEDTTELVRQQENLRANEALFRSTLTSMDDFVSVLDREGRFASFFQGHRRADLFLPPEQFLGRKLADLPVPPEVVAAQQRGFESLRQGEPSASWVYRLPYPSGDRWFHVRLTPKFDAEGRFDGAVQVSRDITDLREAEDALAAREAQLRVVFEAIPFGLVRVNDGVVVQANPAVQQMFGASGLEGAPLESLLVRQPTLQGRRSDGTTFPLRLDAAAVEPGVEVVVLQDLTERQRMERSVLNSQRLESLGVLAGGIAHDFNNLLGGLFGFIQLARKATPDDAPAVRHLDRAFSAFNRAQDLTRQLLTFSKGGEPVKHTLDLGPLLDQSAKFILSGASLKLEVSLEPGLWPCEVDRHQIGQVIDNLGLNARQAVPAGGTVWIRARNVAEGSQPPGLEPGPYVVVEVEDDGPGIPPEILPKIFDPFFSTKKEGTGLGLATVESILRKHGGAVVAESVPGRGALFRLWFPAVPGVRGDDTGASRRLLVIDDEALILETALEMLTDLGYEAVGVSTGVEAVETYRRARKEGRRFGFVLTDLTLPGEKGGLAILDQLRKIDPGLRAAASSGYSDDPVVADPTAWGLEGFLPKPYTREQLAAFLAALVPLTPGPR